MTTSSSSSSSSPLPQIYLCLTGKTFEEDQLIVLDIMKDQFKTEGIFIQQNGRLSIEIILKYLTTMSYNTFSKWLDEMVENEGSLPLEAFKSYSKVNVFLEKDYRKEVNHIKYRMRSFRNSICSVIFKFLRNHENAIRNQNPAFLSHTLPYLITMEEAKLWFTEDVRNVIFSNITKEDEFRFGISFFIHSKEKAQLLMDNCFHENNGLFTTSQDPKDWLRSKKGFESLAESSLASFSKCVKTYKDKSNPFKSIYLTTRKSFSGEIPRAIPVNSTQTIPFAEAQAAVPFRLEYSQYSAVILDEVDEYEIDTGMEVDNDDHENISSEEVDNNEDMESNSEVSESNASSNAEDVLMNNQIESFNSSSKENSTFASVNIDSTNLVADFDNVALSSSSASGSSNTVAVNMDSSAIVAVDNVAFSSDSSSSSDSSNIVADNVDTFESVIINSSSKENPPTSSSTNLTSTRNRTKRRETVSFSYPSKKRLQSESNKNSILLRSDKKASLQSTINWFFGKSLRNNNNKENFVEILDSFSDEQLLKTIKYSYTRLLRKEGATEDGTLDIMMDFLNNDKDMDCSDSERMSVVEDDALKESLPSTAINAAINATSTTRNPTPASSNPSSPEINPAAINPTSTSINPTTCSTFSNFNLTNSTLQPTFHSIDAEISKIQPYNRFIDATFDLTDEYVFFEDQCANSFALKTSKSEIIPLERTLQASSMMVYFQILGYWFPEQIVHPAASKVVTGSNPSFHRKMLGQFAKIFNEFGEASMNHYFLSSTDSNSISTDSSFFSKFFPSEEGKKKFVISLLPMMQNFTAVEEQMGMHLNSDYAEQMDKDILFVTVSDANSQTPKQYPPVLRTPDNTIQPPGYYHQYQLAAVIYTCFETTSPKEYLFYAIGRNTSIDFNAYKLFNWSTMDFYNSTIGSQFQLKDQNKTIKDFNDFGLFSEIEIKRGKKKIKFYAIESIWVRGDARDRSTPFLNYAGNEISSFDLQDSKDKFIEFPVVQCVIHRALDHFRESNVFYLDSQTFSSMLDIDGKYNWNTGIEKWSKGCYSEGKSLFNEGNVIHFTICYETHWYYGIVSMTSKSIVVVDSWEDDEGMYREVLADIIRKFLKDEYNSHHDTSMNSFDEKEWNLYLNNAVPFQSDNNSCGVFTILYALKAMYNREVDYSHFEWKIEMSKFKKASNMSISKLRKSIKEVVVGTKTISGWLNELTLSCVSF